MYGPDAIAGLWSTRDRAHGIR